MQFSPANEKLTVVLNSIAHTHCNLGIFPKVGLFIVQHCKTLLNNKKKGLPNDEFKLEPNEWKCIVKGLVEHMEWFNQIIKSL